MAMHLYEDLFSIDRSPRLVRDIAERRCVLNVGNKRHGVKARRGDGTFGEIVPGEAAISDESFRVARGLIATVEVGVEVKILAKAMIKQIDRVINDLRNQVVEFRKGGGNPICVGIVGVNSAERYVGYEGEARKYPTTGKGGFLHPSQEAHEAERRLRDLAAPHFDEFLVLRFRATNENPFPFEWVDQAETVRDYASALVRISSRYQSKA
ncbi:MAG: hypothetical protein WBG02_07230 [Candidatus Acidiferrum sp.]